MNKTIVITFDSQLPSSYQSAFTADYKNGTFFLKVCQVQFIFQLWILMKWILELFLQLLVAMRGRLNFYVTKSPSAKVMVSVSSSSAVSSHPLIFLSMELKGNGQL